MTETTGGRRSGGRAARQAARAISNAVSVPYITRTLKPFEVLSDEHLVADRGERRHGARAGRDRVPRHARGAAAVQGRGRRHRRRARALPPWPLPRTSCRRRLRATFTQVARNPAHNVEIGGPHTVLRARLRLAVRPRPRQRPPLRHDRGLPQLRQADVHDAVPAPLGRHRLRARRPAGQQAALRHGLRAHALLGQGVHGLGHAPEPGARTRSRWRGSCSAPTSSSRTR